MATSKTTERNQKIDLGLQTKIQNLGLTQSEVKIYLAMLELGQTTVSGIAKQTNLNRRNVYDALSTLIDKGLIFQIIGEKEGLYGAVDPEKLLELVQSKEILLNSIMPDLEKLHKKEFKAERAIIYKGVEGFKKYLQDTLNVGQDVYCLAAKGGWGSPALEDFAQWHYEERKKRNIKVFNLYDEEMREIIDTKKEKSGMPTHGAYGEYRYLPPEFSTNSAVDIFGDRVITFTGLYPERFDDNVTLFVLISQELADAWRTWFQFLWDNCKEN